MRDGGSRGTSEGEEIVVVFDEGCVCERPVLEVGKVEDDRRWRF